jgi:hypothetical protein
MNESVVYLQLSTFSFFEPSIITAVTASVVLIACANRRPEHINKAVQYRFFIKQHDGKSELITLLSLYRNEYLIKDLDLSLFSVSSI